MDIALNRVGKLHKTHVWLLSLAWLVSVLPLMSWLCWKSPFFWRIEKAWWLVALTSLAFFLSAVVVSRLRMLPLGGGFVATFTCFTLLLVGVVAVIAWGRFYYSRSFLSGAYFLGLLLLWIGSRFIPHIRLQRLAIIPGGMTSELMRMPGVEWLKLDEPNMVPSIDGIVVDLHQKLAPAWMRFLSICALKRLPVYHSGVVFEAMTGRASMLHFSDGILEAVVIPPFYAMLKRTADVLIVVATAPLWVPLTMLTAAAVKIDSRGPLIFAQERVGKGGQPFNMYKFRSMKVGLVREAASFAENNDDRVTRVGRMTRKFRLDELPQFINVLKGDMSLIGPRPEQVEFSEKFLKEIPFYGYRHLVRPGITGWAQVNQGYAANSNETKSKLEYDLFYIKYLSFWLDVLVVLKTIRTVATGHGAR